MADNPQEQFEKKVSLILEASMSGMQASIDALGAMKDILGHTQKSTKSLDKAIDNIANTHSKAAKSIDRLSKKSKSLINVQKGLYETMRSVGNITKISLGIATTALTAFAVEAKRIGNTMLQFQTTSLDASAAIGTLSNAYGDLRNQSSSAVLSMQDVAAAITNFQSKGIAQMSATAQEGFLEGWRGTHGLLTQVMGKSNATELWAKTVESLGNEFEYLRGTVGEALNIIAKQIEDAVDPKIKAKFMDEMKEKFKEMRAYSNDSGTAIQLVIGNIETLKQVTLESASPIIQATVSMNKAWSRIGTVIENLSTHFVKTFGPDLSQMIIGIGNWLEKSVVKSMDKIYDDVTALKSRFEEWGGTTELIKQMEKALNYVWQILSKIVITGKDFINWFTEANIASKTLAVSVAAIMISPGLLPNMALLVTGLGGVTTAAWNAVAAMKTMNMTQIAGKAKGFAGKMGIAGLAMGAGHFGGKMLGDALLGTEKGGLADILSGAIGAAGAGALTGAAFGPMGASIGLAIGGIGSLIASAIGSWSNDAEKAIKKISIPKIGSATSKEIEKISSGAKSVSGDKIGEMGKDLEKVSDGAEKAKDKFAEFTSKLKDLESFSGRTLPGFSAAVSGLSSVIDTLGPAVEMFGESLSKVLQKTAVEEMNHAFGSLTLSMEAANIAKEKAAQARLGDDPKLAAQWMIKYGEAVKIAEQATQNLQQSLEASLKPLQKQVELISAAKELRQLDLDISQQLYGTPALAVQAQLELVKTMQLEKETLKAQLATTQDIITQQLASGRSEKEIFFLRMKELDLSKQIKSVTRDQLRQVKELRDGYLSAVQAQALGAGRFSKILITQDQNLMRGLQKEAVKKNFLLGQYGEDAAKSQADAYRFSAQGMGFLETMSGQTMSPQDISKAVYDRVSNISDPLAKASALQSADIFMNIMNGADKNTKDLGNIFALGMTTLGDRFVDAISMFGDQRSMRAAPASALKGAPAGETYLGAAVNAQMTFGPIIKSLKEMRAHSTDGGASIDKLISQMESQFKKPVKFDAAKYREQAEQQGSSQASIEAYIKHMQGKGGTVVSGAVADPTARIDPGKANTFFVQALQRYKTQESLLVAIAEKLGVPDEKLATINNIRVIGEEKVATAFGMSTLSGLSVRGGMGKVGLSQAGPEDSQASKQLVDDLRKSDREVKRHERAHAQAAGPFAEGPPSYTYKKGPDGKRYAVGGQVLVDLSPISGDPQATIDKMRKIRGAALAPRHPSEQDLAVAQQASQIERRIQGSLSTGVLGVEPPESPDISEEPQILKVFKKMRYYSEPRVPETDDIYKPEEPQAMKIFKKMRYYSEPCVPETDDIDQEEPQILKVFKKMRYYAEPQIPKTDDIDDIYKPEEPQAIKIFRRLKDAVPGVPGVSGVPGISGISADPEAEEHHVLKTLRRVSLEQGSPPIWLPGKTPTIESLDAHSFGFDPPAGSASAIGAGVSIATGDAFKPITTILKETVAVIKDKIPTRAAPFKIENLDNLVSSINKSIVANEGNTAAVVENVGASRNMRKALSSEGFYSGIESNLKVFDDKIARSKDAIVKAKPGTVSGPMQEELKHLAKTRRVQTKRVAEIKKSIGGGLPTQAQKISLEAAKENLTKTRSATKSTVQTALKHPAAQAEAQVAHVEASRAKFVKAHNTGQRVKDTKKAAAAARRAAKTARRTGQGRRFVQGAFKVGKMGVGEAVGEGVDAVSKVVSKAKFLKPLAKLAGKAVIPVSLALDTYDIATAVNDAVRLGGEVGEAFEAGQAKGGYKTDKKGKQVAVGVTKLAEQYQSPITSGNDMGARREHLAKARDKTRMMILNMDAGMAPEENEGGLFGHTFDFMNNFDLMGDVTERLGSMGPDPKQLKKLQDQLTRQNKELKQHDLSTTYQQKIEAMDAVADKIAAASPAEMPDFQAEFQTASENLRAHIDGVITGAKTESIEALSNMGPKLLGPYTDELAKSLGELGKLNLQLEAPDADADAIQKELDAQSKKVRVQADFMKGAFGSLGVDAVNEAIGRFEDNMYDKVITPHLDGMQTAVDSYIGIIGGGNKELLQKPLAALGDKIRSKFDQMTADVGAESASSELDKIIGKSKEATDKLLKDQAEPIKAQIEKLRKVDVSNNSDIAKSVQAQIKKLEGALTASATSYDQEYDRLRDYAKLSVEKEAAGGQGKSKAAEDAENYTNVIQHLEKVVSKDINFEDFNLAELKKVQTAANNILKAHEKKAAKLTETGDLTKEQNASLIAGGVIVEGLNRLAVQHQDKLIQYGTDRQSITSKQDAVQKEIANIKLPLSETEELKDLEKQRAQGANLTRENIVKQVPKMVEIADLYKTYSKQTGVEAPTRQPGQDREEFIKSRADFRAEQEASSIVAGNTLKEKHGLDGIKFASNISSMIDGLGDKVTTTPGGIDRGIARGERYKKSKEKESGRLQIERKSLDIAESKMRLSSSGKEVISNMPDELLSIGKSFKSVISGDFLNIAKAFKSGSQQPDPNLPSDIVGAAGGFGGAVGAFMSGDFLNMGEAFKSGSQQAKILQDALGGAAKPMRSSAQILGLSEPKYPSGQGGKAHPYLEGKMPILTAVDTDEHMQGRSPGISKAQHDQQAREKYGRRSEYIIRKSEDLSKVQDRIKKIDKELEGTKIPKIPTPLSGQGKYKTGAVDLHGFELATGTGMAGKREAGARAGTRADTDRGGLPLTAERKEKLESSRQSLRKVNDKIEIDLEKARIAAENAGVVRQTQAERDIIRQQNAAAEGAYGTGYTGEAPERRILDEAGRPVVPGQPIPVVGGFSPAGPISPDIVRGPQTSVAPKTPGVRDPGSIRQLTHGNNGGSFANKGRNIKQILVQAGQMIEQLSQGMDNMNEGQDQITQYASGRLQSTQTVSR